jgi:hypothetical protein
MAQTALCDCTLVFVSLVGFGAGKCGYLVVAIGEDRCQVALQPDLPDFSGSAAIHSMSCRDAFARDLLLGCHMQRTSRSLAKAPRDDNLGLRLARCLGNKWLKQRSVIALWFSYWWIWRWQMRLFGRRDLRRPMSGSLICRP